MLLPTPKEMRPGGPLDLGTLKGCIRCFFLGWIGFLGLWYAIEIFGGLSSLLGVVSDPPTIGQRRFHRFLAITLGGTTIVTSFFIGLTLYIKQNRAQKAAKGQWYDKENLTREDLYGEQKPSEAAAKSPDDPPPP
ncbi:MAG: hypothetical protein QM805_08505 [Pseudomonas sp.]